MSLRNRVTLCLLLLTCMPTVTAAQREAIPSSSPIQATLVIPETKLLPGVPFEMWVELSNPSDASVMSGLCADMIVRPESGESFTISFGGEERPAYPTLLPEREWNGKRINNLLLRPHQKQTLTIPILNELEGPAYFDNDMASRPGRYGITLRLDYCWPGFVTPQASLLPPQFLGAISTNEVIIERITPTGSDAAVWNRMQEGTNGKWIPTRWDHTIISEIITKYSDSNYYPYALLAGSFGAVNDVAYNRFVDAIRRFPTSPVIEVVELYASGAAAAAGKLPASGAHLDRLAKSKRPTTRILAFGREDVPSDPCPANYTCED